MKKSSLSFLFALSAIVVLTACRNTEVGDNRGDVPPPARQPIPGAEVVGPETQTPAQPQLTPIQPVSQAVPMDPVPETPVFELKKAPALTYVVKKGDNPWTIANMYGVSVSEFIAENNLTQKSTIRVGQVVKIPAGGAYLPPEKRKKYVSHTPKQKISSAHKVKTTKTATASVEKTTVAAGEYRVQNGDFPEKIARKHKVSLATFMAANPGLNPTKMNVGDVVKIPGGMTVVKTEVVADETASTATKSTPDVTTEKVATQTPPVETENTFSFSAQEGETLRKVSSDFYIPLADLKALNPGIQEDEPLKEGTRIVSPKL